MEPGTHASSAASAACSGGAHPARRTNSLLPVLLFLLVSSGIAYLSTRHQPLPSDQVITTRSPLDLAMWKHRHLLEHSAAEWYEFDLALLELKYRITARYEATGSDAVEHELQATINGATFRQVLRLGDRAKLARLADEKAQLEYFLKVNATLRTRPDDEASIAYLRSLRDRQTSRLDALVREIADTRSKLAAR